jgi:hypothetical protein
VSGALAPGVNLAFTGLHNNGISHVAKIDVSPDGATLAERAYRINGQRAADALMRLLQDYAYLNLEPIQIGIPLKDALSAENIRVEVEANVRIELSQCTPGAACCQAFCAHVVDFGTSATADNPRFVSDLQCSGRGYG